MSSFVFGSCQIPASHIIYKTSLSFAFVNLRPILPGHILVSPLRPIARLSQLNQDEVIDLFALVHKLAPILEQTYQAEAMTISLQDGQAAGQSIKHLHIHLIPRRSGDFANNDDIYPEIDRWKPQEEIKVDDEMRRPRSHDEMAEEAFLLRNLIN